MLYGTNGSHHEHHTYIPCLLTRVEWDLSFTVRYVLRTASIKGAVWNFFAASIRLLISWPAFFSKITIFGDA